MSEIEKYADKSMYPAQPMASNEPKAFLLWMTPDPLGAIAAACRMYKGIPTYSLSDISDDERRDYWEQSQKTELKAPHEFVKLHFFIEGVDRAYTHQAVRQRTAVYAQESLRFAVKEDLTDAVSLPPSLRDPSRSQSIRNDLEDSYYDAIAAIQQSYEFLIANGVPAEDARSLLPQSTLTRYNYCTDLRNFAAEAGKRLCTQAQFHWRASFLSMRDAVRNYTPDFSWMGDERSGFGTGQRTALIDEWHTRFGWQYALIADSQIFSPVCYQIGKCGFKAEFDRGCTIRERVDFNESNGLDSSLWGEEQTDGMTWVSSPIDPAEWLTDPRAAWEY